MQQRLQKILSHAGIASRRSCEAIIAAGRVTVNGVQVTEVGVKADPDTDDIRLDGRSLTASTHVYLLLNKPTGYVTTVSDPHASHTVMQLLKGVETRVYPVGRLDADSAGLLILSNDGDFTQKMTHPSHQVPKTYRAVVRGEVSSFSAADLRTGVLLDDGMTAPATVEFVDYDHDHNITIVDMTIHEGRNRQVRRMFDAVGHPVLALTRTRIGPLTLQGLAPGTWRRLHATEVVGLLNTADSAPPALPRVPQETDTWEEDAIAPPRRPHQTNAARRRDEDPSRQPERGASGKPAGSGTGKPMGSGTGKPVGSGPGKPVGSGMDPALREAARELAGRLGRDSQEEQQQAVARSKGSRRRKRPASAAPKPDTGAAGAPPGNSRPPRERRTKRP